ncbi:MAG: BTAD domain-containing putative transcriptional regulator [Propionibacteriaceae bacterium]|nr:BTAD domain-containing putative transcriptional regulator [Propionibacteriaceae bacterium]
MVLSTNDQEWSLRLLGGWSLAYGGRPVAAQGRPQRLIALLALRGPTSRVQLRQLLWPSSTPSRAANSLRVALWHISHTFPELLADVHDPISLSADVTVDVHELFRLIDRVESGQDPLTHAEPLRLLAAELLPDWYDEWIVAEQERLRARLLRALERLADEHLATGDYRQALDCAHGAVQLDPLSETSHQLLIECHIGAGNYVIAHRTFNRYRDRMMRELDVEPSPRLHRHLSTLRRA